MSGIQFHGTPSPKEIEALTALRKQTDVAPPGIESMPINLGGGGRISIAGDGSQTVESWGGGSNGGGTNRVDMPVYQRPGMVTIPGVGETTREAAIAAGFIKDDGAQASFQEGRADQSQERGPVTGKANDDDDDTEKEEDVAPEIAAAVSAASGILEQVAGKIGGDAVNSVLGTAAESGEIPVSLPEGMTQGQAQTVWDGYHAQCENVLAGVGASVGMLSEFSTNEELATARRATLLQDTGHLRALGQAARGKLELLPQRDEEHFKELLGTLPAEYRDAVEQGQNGEWAITLPAPIGKISWGTAVRQGYVTL